jgi:hypothetical protein
MNRFAAQRRKTAKDATPASIRFYSCGFYTRAAAVAGSRI